MNDSLDQVILVNSQDEILGQMDKVEAHRGEAKLHRAISVYLFRKMGESENGKIELLMQQRSKKKIVGAGQWANTVCGNVRPNESYEECAYRRLKEELGITNVKLQPLYKFEYQVKCNEEFSEWEMDQVFVGWYDSKVQPNPDEVQNYEWVNWKELANSNQNSDFRKSDFNTKNVTLSSDNLKPETFLLAPWFVMMLGDEELITKLNTYVK